MWHLCCYEVSSNKDNYTASSYSSDAETIVLLFWQTTFALTSVHGVFQVNKISFGEVICDLLEGIMLLPGKGNSRLSCLRDAFNKLQHNCYKTLRSIASQVAGVGNSLNDHISSERRCVWYLFMTECIVNTWMNNDSLWWLLYKVCAKKQKQVQRV